jgi:hypothetical protein
LGPSWFLNVDFEMADLDTTGCFSPVDAKGLTQLARLLIVVSVADIGLSTVFSSFKNVGLKPLVVGLIGDLVVAACSIGPPGRRRSRGGVAGSAASTRHQNKRGPSSKWGWSCFLEAKLLLPLESSKQRIQLKK